MRSAAVRARLLVEGSGRLAAGVLRAATGALLRDQARQAGGLRTGARGLGMAAGALGYVYREYRRSS